MNEGDPLPAFSGTTHLGTTVSNETLNSGTVVLYFYPKDHTPGCTIEAQNFNKLLTEFHQKNIEVYGISTNSLTSHASFAERHNINFPLISDKSGEITKSFGVPNPIGNTARRATFVAQDGKIIKIFAEVNLKTHAREVLNVLNQQPPGHP